MDEIVSVLGQIAEAIRGDLFTKISSIVLTVAPVVLTIITAILSYRMDRQNKRLQIIISNRDTQNQTRQVFFDIYKSYFDAFYYVTDVNNEVAAVFSSEQTLFTWAREIEQRCKDITYAYNKARLVSDDKELIDSLGKALHAFSIIRKTVLSYLNTGIPSQTIENAWNVFSNNHSEIRKGDYILLYQNPILGEEFKKLCSNSYIENIQETINNFISIVECDEFDDKLKKYVRIDNLNQKV